MPRTRDKEAPSLVLVCGQDDFAVKRRAKEVFGAWVAELGGMDHEVIDASVTRSGEALGVLKRLREALQTLPFFGSAKVVWFQNCSFLGDERAAESQPVSQGLTSLAQELKDFDWHNVRLLISAGKVDKRKALYKTIDKLGVVESFEGLSVNDKDWVTRAELAVEKALAARGKSASPEAVAELVTLVGPNSAQLENEVEKVSLYVGTGNEITIEDVQAICTRNKSSRAFALGEALGDRDLPRLLRCLDEELWEVRLDPKRSEIGVLYGLISKIRSMLLLKELVREGWIQQSMDYSGFKAAMQRLPAERLPSDSRFNPASLHPYVLHKALPQIRRYSTEELISAMDVMLRCNQALVSSGADESLLLQQALARIASPNPG
jgi:DNA polymerase-3 subunit delta